MWGELDAGVDHGLGQSEEPVGINQWPGNSVHSVVILTQSVQLFATKARLI